MRFCQRQLPAMKTLLLLRCGDGERAANQMAVFVILSSRKKYAVVRSTPAKKTKKNERFSNRVSAEIIINYS